MKKVRPKLIVFRSNKAIYTQIIDEEKSQTLVAANSLSDLRNLSSLGKLTKTEKARTVGEILAKKALKKGIKKVRFDRGDYKYHGQVKALAEGARSGGLSF